MLVVTLSRAHSPTTLKEWQRARGPNNVLLALILLKASMPTVGVDHIEIVGDRDRVSVSIKRSSTLAAREKLISDALNGAASLGIGKRQDGAAVNSHMKYRSFDFEAGGYRTIYYSNIKNDSPFLTCHIRSDSTRYSAFFRAMQWCAKRLGLAVPQMENLPGSDDRGLLPDELKKRQ